MVATVTGNSLGLAGTSPSVPGGRAQVGNAALGQGGEAVYVNARSGNLIVQRLDEAIAGRGPDLATLRTYNSKGGFDFDNDDGWQLSLYRKLYALSGTVNTAGSTIVRAAADGAQLIYAYDSALGTYVNKDGSGAYDTLAYSDATDSWTWTNGDSRITETYSASSAAGEWRIVSTADTDGNTIGYAYDANGLISLVTDANGEITRLNYGAGTRRLDSIDVISGSVTTTRVRYGYDASGRLASVTTDLTPADGSIADGQTFTTTYAYDGASTRLASIANSDGTRVGITYDASDRVATLIDALGKVTRFTYGADSTTVVDPLGLATTLTYDADGNLVRLQGPDGSGQDVQYAYSASGDLIRMVDSRGNGVSYAYDASGKLTRQEDSAGNVVERTWNSANQLIRETVYAVPDPDGAGTAQASAPQATWYIRDAGQHVRFTISPEGRVTEYRYDAHGQQVASLTYVGGTFAPGATTPVEADLVNWIGMQDKTRIDRTDTAYDARGLVTQVIRYAATDATGAGVANGSEAVTRHVYDAAGRLLQTIDPRGALTAEANDYLTAYAYDGLGRSVSVTQYDAAGSGARQTLTTYDDASRQVRLSLANGLVRVSTYDARGLLLTQVEQNGATALASTRYQYDAGGRLRIGTDAGGGKRYYFYDGLGRKTGEVDPAGALTEFAYNDEGQVLKSVAYATGVSADLVGLFAADADGNVADVALSAIRPAGTVADQVSRRVYDAAGRLRFEIDAMGAVSEIRYDGAGRRLSVTTYANLLNNPAGLDILGREPVPGDIQFISSVPDGGAGSQIGVLLDSANDRVVRNVYDNDGLLRGVLDGEGYLTEYRYDAAGRLAQTLRYSSAVETSLRAAGDLAQLVGSAAASPAETIQTWRHYNGLGQLVATVDGEGYLTAHAYDLHGNPVRTTRFANRLVGTPAAGVAPQVLAAVPAAIPAGGYVLADAGRDQVSQQEWTAFNQLASETAADGTVTRHIYDSLGNLVTTVSAEGTGEAATAHNRYDLQGRLVQALSPLGASALAALGANPALAQVDAVWAAYGTTYAYDSAGRRIRADDANGNVTWFFYDTDNRLTFTVRRVADPASPGQWAGEVSERRYNTLGQTVADIVYANRLGAAVVALLEGGSDAPLQAERATMSDAANDSLTNYTYDADGRLSTTVTALNATDSEVVTRSYNAFGDVVSVQTRIDAGRIRTDRFAYDRRGLQTTRTDDAAVLNRRLAQTYDAFGRVIASTDGRGIVRRTAYDKLGRVIQATAADGSLDMTRSTTFDAFSRVLTRTDANGVVTRYAYDAANRTVTTTIDGGGLTLVTRSVANRRGQTVTVVDANGNENRFSYDANGNLLTQKRWDKASDAETTIQENAYDAAGLLLLTTRDANGHLVAYAYDAAGRVLTQTVDPAGLKLTTRHAYDAMGRKISVTDPRGVVTLTAWDRAGRVVAVTVDPSGANLRTTYGYDLAGELLTVTEGAGSAAARTTQYQYDSLGRRTSQVLDPAGLAVTTLYAYDANDNLASRLEAAGTAQARLTRYAYDDANRLAYTVDALGAVVRNDYDAEGRILQTTAYATAIDTAALAALAAMPSQAAVAALVTASAQDRATRHRYDAAGRERFTIDALGAVTEQRYDANGNVVRRLRYANALAGSLGATESPQVVDAPVAGAYVLRDAADRVEAQSFDAFNRLASRTEASGTAVARTETWHYDAVGNVLRHTDARGNDEWFAYDAANRQTVHIDALGYLTRRDYGADGKIAIETRYMNAVALPAAPDDGWAGHAPAPVANPDAASGDRITRYAYDSAGRLHARTDAAGVTTAYAYDNLGNVIDTTVALGMAEAVTLHRSYDVAGRVLSETRAWGTAVASTTAYAYDTLGNQVSIVTGVGTAGVRTTAQAFDLLGRKTSATDGAGGKVSTAYNAFGDIVKVTDARGNAGYFYTDALGRVSLQVDPEGAVVETRYDLFGDVTDSIRYANRLAGTPDQNTRPRILAAAGSGAYVLADAAADERQSTTRDALGRRTEVRTWWGAGAADYYSERFSWDAAGNMLSSTARNGATTVFEYDRGNRKTREILPIFSRNAGGGTAAVENRFGYDAVGNLTQKVEAWGLPEQRITTFAYDKLNREVARTGDAINTYDPATGSDRLVAPTQRKIYDLRGNLIEEIDARGGRTLHYYDKADRETGRIDAGGAYTVWTYDAVGNKLSQTAFANAAAIVGGGTLASDAPPATVGTVPATGAYVLLDPANDRTTFFLYDAVGRQVGTRVDGMITGYYDVAAGIYRPSANTSIFTQSVHDAAGNLVKSIDGNGNATRYYYNRAGQQVGQLDALGYLVAWTRDAWGNVARQTRYANAVGGLAIDDATPFSRILSAVTPDAANDRITEYAYDRMNRVVGETVFNVASGSVSASGALSEGGAGAVTRYAYDGLNNIVRKVDATGAASDWTYDAGGRKTHEARPAFTDYRGVAVRPTTDYEYNGLNNLSRQIDRGDNDAAETDDRITTYAYGAGGFAASRTDAVGAVTRFRVDANGNVTQVTLVGRVNAAGASVNDVVTYQYDAMNRQVKNTDVGTGTVNETRYNVFGQVTGKRTNGGGAERAWTEFADYDQAGRIWRGNSGDGITKVWVFDKAGNATLKIDSAGADLSTLDLAGILALKSPVTNQTVSVYDARNQLVDTIQPSMLGDGHQTIAIQQTLIEARGTSFAGVGNVMLTQQAGLGTVNAVGMPTAVGAVSISRAQTIAAKMTDSYTYAYDSYGRGGMTSASHTLSVGIPDTSALGSGNLRVHVQLDGAAGLGGGGNDAYVAANASSASVSFSESCSGSPTAARGYSYAIYKQTANGEILIASYSGSVPPPVWGSQSTNSSTVAMSNTVHFSGQRPDAARLILMSRPAGANSGWTVTDVPRLQRNGSAVAGWFALDWSAWNRGNYEFQYVVLDGANNVVNSEQGQMLLSDTAPKISQMAHSIGGAGRAFMDANGAINITEQGATARTLTILYRHAGSTEAWSSRVLAAAAINGLATPGWFVFDTAGLSGRYEYTIEARDAAGATLNKAGATFVVGDAGSVLDPAGTSALVNPSAAVGASAIGSTSVSGVFTDSYSFDSVYNTIMTGSNHSLSLNLPNTSAWGEGSLYVTASMQGISNSSGTLSGSNAAVWVPNGQLSTTIALPETFSYVGGNPGPRNHAYGIYKQTDNGLLYLGGTGYTTASPAASVVSQDLVSFKVQATGAATASRMLMQYRRAGTNGGWSVMEVPPQMVNGQRLANRFAFDWSGWTRGAYEYRTLALDTAGNVLNSGGGTMNLQDGAPSISKSDDLIGGAGRVFMDTAGRLNFTEQGTAARTLAIRTRAAGSSGLWSERRILAPAVVGSAATPGWFQFDPVAAGLSGNTEYVVEARNEAGQVLQKTAGSFVVGQPTTVSALQGYFEPAPVARFNQPVGAETMTMYYRRNPGGDSWSQASLPKTAAGVFDWDTGNVFRSDTATADYEYRYETRDAAGTLVNKAHGGIRLGSAPSVLSHVNDNLPTLLSFTPPAGNAQAASAPRMTLNYRLAGSGTWQSATLTRSDLAGPFVLDASSLIPPGSLGSLDYRYTLQDAAGANIKAADGSDLDVSGVIQVGTAPDAQVLAAVATGSTGPTVSLIHRRQAHNAFGEVSSETDGRGYVTQLTYNTLGKLTQKADPETTVVLANGYAQRQRPISAWIYDLAGNLVGQRDANGRLTTLAVQPGGDADGKGNAPVLAEYHADGGVKRTAYDRLGNARILIDEIGRRSDYGYDLAGQLVRIDRPAHADGRRAWDAWAYDAAGRRIRHTTSADGSTLLTDTTDYDSQGRVTATTSALGRRTRYEHLWKADIAGIATLKTGGWQTTTTDAMGRTQIDETDLFGRKTKHTDLGGRITTYVYNQAGWLTQQASNAGQNLSTDYYANGYVKRITDHALATRTDYEYDDNGNRTYEAYQRTVSGPNGAVTEYLQNATVAYDELNRVKEVIDPRATIRYEYDANGNRRHVWSYYHNGVDGNVNLQDYWYLYDAMNRFTVSMGQLSTGARGTGAADGSVAIVAGSVGNGVEIAYNQAGERKRVRYARDNHVEDYDYDATGHLTDTWLTPAGGARALAARRQNDLLGRVTAYSEYNAAGGQTYTRNSLYDADHRLISQSGTDGSTTFAYYNGKNADGSDNNDSISQSGAGELARIETTHSGTTTTTWTAYSYWDTAREIGKTIRGYNPQLKQNNGLWKPGMSSLAYDVNGHLQSATDAGKDGQIGTADDIRLDYIDNAQGLTLRRDQVYGTTVAKTRQYLYLDGHGIGDVGNDGDTLQDYAQSLARVKRTKEQTYKNWTPADSADFDQNWQPINPDTPGATPGSYTIKTGDTLQGIAAAVWGDGSLWYLIADANGLAGTSALTAGQTLTLPNKVTNLHNNAETWRPYDAGRIIGDTSPTLPDAPPAPPVHRKKKKGCGGIGSILVAIVVVVVTIYTAGAASVAMAGGSVAGTGFAGTMAAGVSAMGSMTAVGFAAAAIGGAVGSVVGQGLSMAMGLQDKFSWGAVAAGALGAVAGGAASGLAGGGIAGVAAANVATQGVRHQRADRQQHQRQPAGPGRRLRRRQFRAGGAGQQHDPRPRIRRDARRHRGRPVKVGVGGGRCVEWGDPRGLRDGQQRRRLVRPSGREFGRRRCA
ncbi:MAG: LysM peptidoglycan-binding domain-containing protein [Rhodocyclales bacterium]|nr:LysM peptidoglycan-binding domain-containing protein [Rhodocyclales bacterium]